MSSDPGTGTGTVTGPPVQSPPKENWFKRTWRQYWYAYVMVLPVLVFLGAFVAYPLVWGVRLSFTNATEATIGTQFIPASYDFIGLENYYNTLFGDGASQFWELFARSVVWTFGGVVFHYLIGLMLAIMLNRQLRGRGVYRTILILPWAVPMFVSAFAWRFIYNDQFGIANWLLDKIGLGPVSWLGASPEAFISVLLVNIWLGFPFMMVALLGGLQSIPDDQYEAAEVDGASAWQRFRFVTMPGLRSVSSTVLLLGCIWTFNQFAVIFLMLGINGGPEGKGHILVTYAYQLGFASPRQYALATTYGVLILSILIVFALFYRRALRSQGEVW